MADITWQDSSAAILDPPSEAESGEPVEADEFDRTDRMYIVREDDSLSSIARKFYGTASARRRIIEANRRLIRDPFLVQPGWRLRIPA
jgi:nucleoid-associated protein YgaU